MSTSELYDAFQANTSDHKSFEALVKHLVGEDDRASLEELYQQLPSIAPDGAQSTHFRVLSTVARVSKGSDIESFLHYQNGLLLWKGFEEPQKAEMSFRKVSQVPEDPTLLREFYLDFYVAQNNWRRLEQFMTDPAKGGIADPVEAKEMLARLAEEQGQPDKAISFWQGVRTADPEHAVASTRLRALYVEVGKWHAMIDLLKEDMTYLGDEDTGEKIAIQQEMIEIYRDKMNAASKVVGCYNTILEIDPGDTDALDALGAEFAAMNRWPDLVKILKKKIAVQEDPEKLIALHGEIATIMLDRFSNTSEAIKSYEAILELDPDNADAIRVLKKVYEERRDWESFIQINEREIALCEDDSERRERFIELARLSAERIRKPALPISLWERVLAEDESHVEALTNLESLYEREKNFLELATVLERRANLETDKAVQVQLLEKLGTVASVRLSDDELSTDVWRRVLAVDPTHRKALAELKKKYIAERDWDNLEWFFKSYGEGSDYVRTLESQAKSIKEPEERTTLLFRAAAIWKDELGETRRAVKNLESVLELSPRHVDAARMLIPIYKEIGKEKSLPTVFDIVLEASDDKLERRELLLELADVQEHKIGDVDAAFFAHVQAVSETPDAVELHGELRRLAEASKNWETYVYALQESADQITSPRERIGVLLEAGRVYRDYLADDTTALSFFNRVLQIDEFNRDALLAAEKAYANTGAHDQLIVVYERKLSIAESPDERRDNLFALATVWREKVGANNEAEAILSEMLDDFPDESRVHDELIAIYMEGENYKKLPPVLERKRDTLLALDAPASVLANIECELGMLAYGIAKTPDGGVDTAIEHYEAALRHEPNHEATVQRLEELISSEDHQARITELLVPVYEASAHHERLADVLELKATHAANDDDRGVQIELLRRLAGIYRNNLDNRELSWRTNARLFTLTPEDADVRAEFQRLTTEFERWSPLVALYTEQADEPSDKDSRLAIKLEVARNWQRRLGSLEDARVFYHKVLDEEPEHQEALSALEGIYVDLDRSEDLFNIYRKKVELSDDVDQKLDYLFRTVDLLSDRLDQPEDAIIAAQEALDLQPGHLPTIQRLDELYTKTEQWPELCSTLEDTIRIVADDRDRVTLLKLRLATVHERHMEDTSQAIGIYASVLEVDSDNQGAVEALERLFKDEDFAERIAPIIEPYYDRRGDWQKLVDVYCVREAATDDIVDKVAWNYKTAELYEHLGGLPENAFNHYEAAASLDPGNERTIAELLRLADHLDNHGELVLFLQSIVDEIDDDFRRKETHRTIAALARDKSADLEGAEKHLRAILEIDPADVPATDELIALYQSNEQPDKTVEMLLVKANFETQPDQRRALYAQAGQLSAEHLDNPEQAIEIYENLHSLDTSHGESLTALEGLYSRVEDWDNLVRVHRLQIEGTDDVDQKVAIAGLMGRCQSEQLGSREDAIDTWHSVLKWQPGNGEALDELDRLYTAQEDWFNLQDVLTKKQSGADDEAWASAQFRIAKLYESDDQLADVRRAITAHGALLERNPAHEGATESLKAILAEGDAFDEAFGVLSPVLDLRDAHEELWDQYQVLAGHHEDEPNKQVETLHSMAQLAERKLFDPERALGAHARAFEADARNATTIGELERLAADNGFYGELVGIYKKGADSVGDDYLGRDLRLKAAAIEMDKLDDVENATATYRKVYEDFADNSEVLTRLRTLYGKQGLAAELNEVVRQQVDTSADDAERVSHLEALATIREEQLKDAEGAYEAYVEMLEIDRQSPLAVSQLRRLFEDGVNRVEIGDRLEPIYRDQEAWDDLISLNETKLGAMEEPEDRMLLMQDLARLSLEQKGDKVEALGWFGKAFRIDPEDMGLQTQLAELAGQTERWSDYKDILLDGAAAATEDDRKVGLWQAAAEVARDKEADTEMAEAIFEQVLEVDGEHLPTLNALDAMFTGQERWKDLEGVLVKLTTNDDVYDDARIKLYERLANLYRYKLEDRPNAVASWRQILELNDMYEPALSNLYDIYQEDENWSDLFGVLQRLVDVSRVDSDRVRYMSEMAIIAEAQLDDTSRAIELWEDVLSAAPQDREAAHELQRLLRDAGKHQELADAYERELRMDGGEPERERELHKSLGRLWVAHLDDPFQAQVSWQQALDRDGKDREALDALITLHRDGENEDSLSKVLEKGIASEQYDSGEQLGLWRELAVLRTEAFGDRAGGIDAWRSVMALSPGDQQAQTELEQLYESDARWPDLADLYRTKLDTITDEDERVETWLQLATIQQDNLQDTASAAGTYRDILAAKPDNVDASMRLETIYTADESWEELSQLLLERNDHLPDADDRMMNLQRLAKLHEDKLDDTVGAFLVVQSAVMEVPTEPSLLADLERLGAQTAQWEELQKTYEEILPAQDDDTQLEVMVKSADLMRNQLGQPTQAIALYERVIEGREDHEAALRALVELNADAERHEQLVVVQQGLADITPNYGERMTLLKDMARVYETNIGDKAQAVDAWQQASEVDEMDLEPLNELERMFIELEDWPALIGIYERQGAVQPEREGELKLKTGGIYEQHLGKIDEAIEQYEAVLNFDPSNEDALEALEDIYGQREDWAKLVEVYERSFDAARNDDERLAVARKIALLQDEFFGDKDAAADSYHRVLSISPTDADAFEKLGTIYRDKQAWEDLISLYESRYETAPTADERANALTSMANIYRHELDDFDNAISMYERVLLERRTDVEAMVALDEMYRSQELWEQVLEVSERRLEVEQDAPTRVLLLARQGSIARDQLEDTFRAAASYQRLLKESPTDENATSALIGIYSAEERYDKVVEVLEHKLEVAPTDAIRSDTHVALASVKGEQLLQDADALVHLESAARLNPESRAALNGLADYYMREKGWTKAMPLLELLVDKLDPIEDRPRLTEVHKRLGQCAEAVYQYEQALDEYTKAAQLQAPDREVLQGLARLHYRKENYGQAERYLQQVLDDHRDALGDEELTQLYMQQGESALKLGDIDKAQRYLGQVVEHDPSNVVAVEQIVQVLEAHNDWPNAIHYKKQLLTLKTDPVERYQVQLSMGDIYKAHLRDIPKATEAYREAMFLDVFPMEPALKLVELSIEGRDYHEAISYLNRLIKLADDPHKKAQFAQTGAVLYRDHLDNGAEAVKYFNLTLDNNVDSLQAFRSIDELLTKGKEWKKLEQNYRRMIQRVQQQGPSYEKGPNLLFMLYRGLGEIYRSRLKRTDYAISAFELARKQRPKDEAVREILSSLYEVTPDGAAKAVAEHRFLVRQQPNRFESYHKLVELLRKVDPDAAWVTAGVLVALGKATPGEQSFYQEYLQPMMARPQRVIDPQLWSQAVKSTGEDLELGNIFRLVYQGLNKSLPAQSLKAYGLKKKARINLDDGSLVATTIGTVAKTLGYSVPEVYSGEQPTGIQFIKTAPPALVVGTDMKTGRSDKEIAFFAAKQLTYCHPAHVIATLYPRQNLDPLYMAAARLIDPSYQPQFRADLPKEEVQKIQQSVMETHQVLDKNISSETRQELTEALRNFWKRNKAPDAGRWHRHIELTANHAAVLMCNDIALAGQLIKSEQTAMSKLKSSEKLKEFVHYCMSEQYLGLRKRLGLQIDYSDLR